MTTTLRTSCTRDCPDACGLLAHVEDGRVVRLSGDPDHPITRGFLCYRVGTHFLDRHYSRERLRTPLLRRVGSDGPLVPIGWDEALDFAASRIDRIRRESGGAAILHSQGGGSLGILKNLNPLFARMLGASGVKGDVCDGAGSAACELDFGAVDANDPQDLLNAGAVILWGKNVGSSSPHTTPLLTEAKRRGAEVWLIDPLPHRSAALADHYVQPRPGGDGALALAVARAVIDAGAECGELEEYADGAAEYRALALSRSVAEWAALADVDAARARELARVMVERAPVTTLVGWGLQRRVNGANQLRLIHALHALTGNLGSQGAGVSFSTTRRKPFDLAAIKAEGGEAPRRLSLPRLGREILEARDPPIRAVLIDNHNPVATNAESATTKRALESREFVMVIDQFLTDTARCATLVLPSTTMLEEHDVIGSYSHHYVSGVQPVVERLEGTRSDLEIYQALAQRLGFGDALAGTPQQWIAKVLGRMTGVDHATVLRGAVHDPNSPRIAFAGRRFATPSGRLRLAAEFVPPPPQDDEFPLRFQALSTGRWQASQLTEADEDREGPLVVTVHPEVGAAGAGIRDGGRARLESRLGALEVVVRCDPAYRRDTVYAPRARSAARGLCVNLLIGARLTDLGEGAAYYDEGVRLVAAP